MTDGSGVADGAGVTPVQGGPFDGLSPDIVLDAVESSFAYQLDGSIQAFNSYINRVYGLRDEDGQRLVAKFYRPGRWSEAALEDEQAFVAELAEAEIPVALPLPGTGGQTLCKTLLDSTTVHFAVYPLKGGRSFDPTDGDDWFRIGSLLGRLHTVGATRAAPARITLDPTTLTARHIIEIENDRLMAPEEAAAFSRICARALSRMEEDFTAAQEAAVALRIHGDLHRGNILERPGEGLMLMDFDDMANGPAVQDIWMLLPGCVEDSGKELAALLEGYESFRDFDRRSLTLVEDLRFMRMIHFIHWCARQRHDARFSTSFPDWGSKGFWIKEVEDLDDQLSRLGG